MLTYKRAYTKAVCDNTAALALGEKTAQEIKVRHVKGARLNKLTTAHALGILNDADKAFEDEVRTLTEWRVSQRQFTAWMHTYVGLDEASTKHAKTIAEKRIDSLSTMWDSDPRVSPWRGTGFGVLQAANTTFLHNKRGAGVERTWNSLIDGKTRQHDQHALQLLRQVTA
jgi:hypothetical protein